jgi:hypothetical protein
VRDWGAEAIVQLAHNPQVAPLLEAALGKDYRLDHDYAHALAPAAVGAPVTVRGQIHNVAHSPPPRCAGARLWGGRHRLITVVYDLLAAAPRDGGFGCVPGSHAAGYQLPIPRDADPRHGYPPLVARVPCRPGSAVVFTEMLHHCTLPWVGAGERRTLFFKYSPRDGWNAASGDAAEQYRGLEGSPAVRRSSRLRAILCLPKRSKL